MPTSTIDTYFCTVTAQSRVGILTCHHIFEDLPTQIGVKLTNRLDCSKPWFDYTAEGLIGPAILDEDGDAAVIWLDTSNPLHSKTLSAKLPLTGIRQPKVGDILIKNGLRTGVTRARVTRIGSLPTEYDHGTVAINGFYLEPIDNQPKHQLICAPGDSGAVWFDEQTNEAVGLHFAGEANPFYGPVHAKACFMSRVLDRLGVELY